MDKVGIIKNFIAKYNNSIEEEAEPEQVIEFTIWISYLYDFLNY